MAKTTRPDGRLRTRRVAAVPVALATLALTQTAASATPPIPGPKGNDVASVLDRLNAHRLVVTDGIERTTYSSSKKSDRLVVRVAVIDPDKGAISLGSTVGEGVGVRETTSAMLKTVGTSKTNAPYVGVNGGYSVAFKGQNAQGKGVSEERSVPLVASIQEDVVQGASCLTGQNAVVLQHGRPHFTRITTSIEIRSSDGARRSVDGVNRYPGWISFCRQGDDDRPLPFKKDAKGKKIYLDERGRAITSGPYYEDAGEIVAFTSAYGLKTPKPGHSSWVGADNAEGVQVQLNAQGVVVKKQSTKVPLDVPAKGMVLQGIGPKSDPGSGAEWLRDHAKVGMKLRYTQRATDIGFTADTADDERLALDPAHPSIDVVNGTHLLMRNGKVVAKPGDNKKLDPRTAIGTDSEGRTLLVTVTSKKDGDRLGVPIHELAKIMADLGAVDALNLDGGGSTTFVADGERQSPPSDKEGERPVYDAVYAGRGGHGLPATGR
ncbi:phosphodiester glycosidase family protein [Streptomyces sp. LX-29]|uniref:phosphodiester glycosidase family protein n=1 Tax=Streptomyces sp. LX-29 TaxID=2900152 RepID=UPI00240E835D|nr:phosphodiester glycosidase family protein [Streptomyces sp. LX-29]WFB10866.1 phosphodiester glycosidase family protein [Streptomyces sp. LX-29]